MMCNRELSYGDYQDEFESTFMDARREAYYYDLVKLFLRGEVAGCKVVPVYDNKGYANKVEKQLHCRSRYADSKSLQDFIIVPNKYRYEETTRPYVSVEVKRPNLKQIDNKKIRGYTAPNLLHNTRVKNQLNAEFNHCDYIIFTDCITWCPVEKEGFLVKNEEKIAEGSVCLIDTEGNWEQDKWEELKCKIGKFVGDAKKRYGDDGQADFGL